MGGERTVNRGGQTNEIQKKIVSIALALAVMLTMAVPAFAAVEDTGFADVDADAWYAQAVTYCQDHDLMGGTGGNAFSPDATMSRAMLAMVLYRLAGSPDVTGADAFTDTADGAWYADAVLWASQQGIIGGYGNGLFGTNDPVTREQFAAILWRYAGSASTEAGADFADENSISSYAVQAVDWVRASGIMGGIGENRFDPKGTATRAQAAMILMNYDMFQQGWSTETPDPLPENNVKVLVAYFSATNNTEGIAQHIADALGADLYEITPEVPYTAADLNYNTDCRANREQNDASARPAISGSVENMEQYDVVFLGYPIWWGQAP